MPPVGFEPTVSAGERPQTHALDRAATGIAILNQYSVEICEIRTLQIMSDSFLLWLTKLLDNYE